MGGFGRSNDTDAHMFVLDGLVKKWDPSDIIRHARILESFRALRHASIEMLSFVDCSEFNVEDLAFLHNLPNLKELYMDRMGWSIDKAKTVMQSIQNELCVAD